jgi:RNA polymerase sigma-70 factor (ECF subfamily)
MDDERRLMRRLATGDQGALQVLMERYGGRLLAVAARLLQSRADAEDAVQRAFVQCYTAAPTYRAEWAVSTWLYRILTNICVDELRRRSVRDAHAAAPPGSDAMGPGPGEYVDLHRALERVPREARILLALRYVDGLSYGELARVRGISVNTVKSQLARGKSLLRAALEGGRPHA